MFNLFKKKESKVYENDIIYAPISGTIKKLEDVEDKVFSQKMMGDGIAIIPDGDVVYAPTNGKLSVMFKTGHAVGVESDYGTSYIIHIGIDTVNLEGQGFKKIASQDDKIEVGDKLIKLDIDYLKSVRCMDTMVVIENSADYDLEILKEGHIDALEPLIKLHKKD